MKFIPGNSRIFLIAEDIIGIDLKKKLEKQGHNVMLACNFRKAYPEILAYDPHVILLDISLPTLETRKLLRKMRQSDKTKEISIIFISNLDTSSLKTLRTARGLYSTQLYFVKSAWTLSALVKKINSELLKTFN